MPKALVKNTIIAASIITLSGFAASAAPQDLSSGKETIKTKAEAVQAPEKKSELSPEMKALLERHKAEQEAMKKAHADIKARWEKMSDTEKAQWKAKMKAEKEAMQTRHKAELDAAKKA
jgi:hypothetical protein